MQHNRIKTVHRKLYIESVIIIIIIIIIKPSVSMFPREVWKN